MHLLGGDETGGGLVGAMMDATTTWPIPASWTASGRRAEGIRRSQGHSVRLTAPLALHRAALQQNTAGPAARKAHRVHATRITAMGLNAGRHRDQALGGGALSVRDVMPCR
ncbi:hypothetical protein [Actinomadura rubrisoli]|uniref:hypothetical protein n=1 Tax=Actinomadura rubrisoli TaxID=2530368 RepID=UPI001405145E|nr:hypothetical protein [Actinomadura rubrisoli]